MRYYLVGFVRIIQWIHTPSPFTFWLNRFSKLNKQQIAVTNSTIDILILVIIVSNFLACFWIFLGSFDYRKKADFVSPNSWIYEDELDIGDLNTNAVGIYIFSMYHIWTILTSVGYGSFARNRVREMWFIIACEVITFGVSASTLFIITNAVNGIDNSYD